jgi:RNA polymerase sigma-54 factor
MRHGIDFIKPLTLEIIAREIGHDISTVSRATNGKYVKTPFGLFELKFFFAKQVKDNMATNLRVDKKIAEIIENEDKNSPLSDDEIALRLKEEGIEIARRTVAKRRTMLKIPSAHERKNEFRFTSGRNANV